MGAACRYAGVAQLFLGGCFFFFSSFTLPPTRLLVGEALLLPKLLRREILSVMKTLIRPLTMC